jgi:uncharacterized protein (DUF1800 family)
MITRRDCLKCGGAAAAAVAMSGCAQITDRLGDAPADWDPVVAGGGVAAGAIDSAVRRTLNRAAFGPRPGDLERVQQMGLDAYLEEQLHPERIEESTAVGWQLWRLDSLEADTDFRYELPKEQVQVELQQAAVIRARYSRRQLQEVMVDFWTDHFNISQVKGDSAFLKTADDDDVIRRHALGKFRDLLHASATSPAMLYYLDNARNTKAAGNENYARELMELHTLGVHGGYTQRDVQEVARCFTGWGVQDERTWWRGAFVYRADRHDDGARQVLGVPLPAGLGRGHGERVLELLADHPATAHFISRKLCRRFIADAGFVPEALAERLAQTFRRSGGDIRQVMSVLLRSEEFRRGAHRKLKRPFDYVISALRALGAETNGRGVLTHLRQMGQLPYQWAMPNGYPDRVEAWLPSLLGRWNFALALVSGRIPGTRVSLPELLRAGHADRPGREIQGLQAAILGRALEGWDARQVVGLLGTESPSEMSTESGLQQMTALMLMSPAFQWR